MTTVSNPTTLSSTNTFTVFKAGDSYYAQTKSGTLSHDDSASSLIQDCIDNLTADRTWKESILLRGDIELDGQIELDSYTILELDGKVTLADNADCHMLYATGKSNFDIIGGEWDGNGTEQTTGTNKFGFYFISCTNFLVKEVKLHGIHQDASTTAGDGIRMRLCSYGTIKDCTIYDCGNSTSGYRTGIYGDSTSDCQIRGNSIYNCASTIYFTTTTSAVVEYVERNHFVDNTVYDCPIAGIGIVNAAATDYVRFNVVANNVVYNCDSAGIKLSTTYAADLNTISGNNIYCSGTPTVGSLGISIVGSNNAVVGNTLYNLGGTAITIYLFGNNTVVANTIDTTTRSLPTVAYGIKLTDTAYNIVSNNYVGNVDDQAIYLILSAGTVSNNNIQGNIIESPLLQWIYVEDATDANNRIEGNQLVGTSGGGGLGIKDDSTTTVINNNTGYINEKMSTATILNGQAAIVVTHGLADISGTKLTPTKIIATGTTADTASLFVDTVGDTTFTINATGAVGGNRTVYWHARV